MTLTLVVPGPPVAFARTRIGIVRGRAIRPFTPRPQRNQAAFIKLAFAEKYPDHVPLEGPVEMDVLVYFAIPKSASKAKAREMKWQRILPTKKPDGSNVLKLVEDALNGLAYRDDCQLVYETVVKEYDDRPRIEIKVRPFGEEP